MADTPAQFSETRESIFAQKFRLDGFQDTVRRKISAKLKEEKYNNFRKKSTSGQSPTRCEIEANYWTEEFILFYSFFRRIEIETRAEFFQVFKISFTPWKKIVYFLFIPVLIHF